MKPLVDRVRDLFRRPLPALGMLTARCRPRALGSPLQRIRERAGRIAGGRPVACGWRMVSLPLATAAVAGIAAVVLLIDALGTTPQRREPDEATVVAEPEKAAANPFSGLAVPAPEPAAGPETEAGADADVDADADADGADDAVSRPTSGRRALPEIPDVAMELDDIARELQRRRTEVLELEAALALREAAVRAAEADLEAQVDRLEAFKLELEALVGEAEAEEEERLQQLVRVYESMRAKSAAAIFDRLELPVILAVAERMREAKMAAILAGMDPARARVGTGELARQRELPRLD